MLSVWIGLLTALSTQVVHCKDYSGYRIFSVYIQSHEQGLELLRLQESEQIDFLSLPVVNRTAAIVVAPEHLASFKGILESLNYRFKISTDELKTMIEKEKNSSKQTYWAGGYRTPFKFRPFKDLSDIFVKYPRYAEILRWIKQVTEDFPNLAVQKDIGKTVSGKPMMVLKLSNGVKVNRTKPAIWLDGSIHGREWIAATTVLYISRQLFSAYEKGETHYIDEYDWYFLPVANPDGYEFSHSADRLWRKNRRPVVATCYGVDLNRNFGIRWGVTKASVSSQGCSEQYGGQGPFTEPETMNIRDALGALTGNLKVYLSFHSYSQLWLVPWGYGDEKPNDYNKMMCVARKSTEAARAVHGLDYRVGTLSQLLYAAAGGSFDWAKAEAGAEYSYTVELRPTPEVVGPVVDRGFLVDPVEIIPAGEEMWAAVKTMIEVINKEECK